MLFRANFIILFFVNVLFVNCERYPLDVDSLHKKQRENKHIDTYLHTKMFFDSIHSGKPGFEHVVIKDKVSPNAYESYEKMSTEALHKTTTTVTFLPNVQYFSLDNASISHNIDLIDLQYIVDCNTHKVNVGDYYIGTSDSKHKDINTQSNNGAIVGFIFSRRVIEVHALKSCVRVFTDVVHPIQIMDTKIVSRVELPYNRIYIPKETGRRNLNQRVIKSTTSDFHSSRSMTDKEFKDEPFTRPDAPLLLCTDNKVTSKLASINKKGSGSASVKGIPLDYGYALDVKGNECIDASVTVPGSFNYNHATGTNAIQKTIDLGNGITCTNCYSFLGASMLAVFNIFGGKITTFAFQAKEAGGAGFNIGLTLSNPSFYGSKYVNLAGPGKTSSIPITLGLSFDINFGGAWATVKGSGSAIGKASVSSGYTLYEEDYIMYANSKWSAKHTLTNSNQLKPVYSVSGFKLSDTSLSALVSISAKIVYSLGGSIPVVDVGASIEFSTVLTASAQYVKERVGITPYSLELSFDDMHRQLSTPRSAPIHCPGKTIKFHIKYNGLNPTKNHDLYFNLHHSETKQNYHIMVHKFKSSRTGSGKVDATWTIPYDSKFMADGPAITFSVHSSARLNRYFTKMPVKLTRTCAKPIFNIPSEITTDRQVQIKWDKEAMRHFKHIPGTNGMGKDIISPKVNLILVVLEKNGSSNAFQFANNIDNSGTHNSVIPDTLREIGRKFLMVIHDSKEYTKMAWDNKTFTLTKPSIHLRGQHPISLLPVYVPPPSTDENHILWGNITSIFKLSPIAVRNASRELIGPTTCRGASISLMLQIEFGFNSFTILGRSFALGSTNSKPYVIVPQTNYCI